MRRERLYHADQLGPCRATVEVYRVQLASGRITYDLTETWSPPGETGTITAMRFVATGEEAQEEARRIADQWQRSSARSDELAPGGTLPGTAPA